MPRELTGDERQIRLLSHILSPLNHSFLSREGGHCEPVKLRQVKCAEVKAPINNSSHLCQMQALRQLQGNLALIGGRLKITKGKKNERGKPLLF